MRNMLEIHCSLLLRLITPCFCAAFFFSTSIQAADSERAALKVCADPYAPPFSTRDESGFENKIARLIADELNLPLEFTWFPQRMGFIRNTLRAQSPDGDGHKCDLVIGVPSGFELAITTDPYYHSTYALVLPLGGKLASIQTGKDLLDMESSRLQDLRIGTTERSPGALWLAKYDLHKQIAPYIAQSGDPNEFAGQPMFENLLSGDIDAAVVWGPTAGYFSSKGEGKLRIIPLASEDGVKFDFRISAAVRFGEGEWRDQVDSLLKKNSANIRKLLESYGVPLLSGTGR